MSWKEAVSSELGSTASENVIAISWLTKASTTEQLTCTPPCPLLQPSEQVRTNMAPPLAPELPPLLSPLFEEQPPARAARRTLKATDALPIAFIDDCRDGLAVSQDRDRDWLSMSRSGMGAGTIEGATRRLPSFSPAGL